MGRGGSASAAPARGPMADAKDEKIAALEKEVAELKAKLSSDGSVSDTLGLIQSMGMQSAMTQAKQSKVLEDALDRIESMAMAQATAIAKFQKDMSSRMEMTEGMLMSQSHVASKAQKSIDSRIESLEGMMMQSAMTSAKQSSQIAKLVEKADDDDSSSESDDDDDDGIELDAATMKKLKIAAYEKMAKDKGVTLEELKASAKDMSEEEKAAMKGELSDLASKAVTRAHIKRTAGIELAHSKGFGSLEELEAHIKSCPEEEKAALLKEMNELAQKSLAAAAAPAAAGRSGKSLWKKAKVMIPVRVHTQPCAAAHFGPFSLSDRPLGGCDSSRRRYKH